MTKAIRMSATGGPQVMQYVDVDLAAPGAGEARVRHAACGVNFVDVYFRTGLYPQSLPGGLGQEGAGTIEAIGSGVTDFAVGDRVAYAGGPNGSYSEERNIAVAKLVKLPDAIGFDTAAAMMLRGMTVQYLLRQVFALKGGETILFHAAAGGIGLIAGQWARALGVNMIGTVGSDEKAALAKAHGCAHVINYTTENFVERVKEITGGKGVPVVYDSIGKDTFAGSLDCLSRRGLMVSFGNASGPVPPLKLSELASRGSLSVTRPTLGDFIATRETLDATSGDLFGMVKTGQVIIEINQRYALKDVAQAHIDMEARKTTGSTILTP
ncbi:MAG TPA: quinone oxidoreductase [Herbaspirillum sp.]